MKQHGFTIVEIIITLAIMSILLTIAVLSLRNSQAAARDDERDSKAQSIATGLESYYNHGFNHPTSPSLSQNPGQYPSLTDLNNAYSFIDAWLNGVDSSTTRFTWQEPSTHNLKPYQNSNPHDNGNIADITSKVKNENQLPDTILYEPLRQRDTNSPSDNDQWEICTTTDTNRPCTRFNLYYLKEAGDNLITIRSKNG